MIRQVLIAKGVAFGLILNVALAVQAYAGTSPKVWIFSTPMIGEQNTRHNIAAQVAADFEEVALTGPSDTALNAKAFMREHSGKWFPSADDYPDLIINSASQIRDVNLTADIKRLSKGKTRIVNLTDPKTRREEFDLIVKFKSQPNFQASNIYQASGFPSGVTPLMIEEAKKQWADKFKDLPHPIVSVSIGGSSAEMDYKPVFASALGIAVKTLVQRAGGSLIVTNSRRTPKMATASFLKEMTGVPFFFHDSEDQAAGNPYLASLAMADIVVVTGDSMSMIADGLVTGKPVYVFAPSGSVEDRHLNYLIEQYRAGRVRPLENKLETWTYSKEDTTGDVAQEIRRRFIPMAGCEAGVLNP